MFKYDQLSPLYTDLYQLTMSQAYFLNGRHEAPASFDYFFRKLPFSGGYVIFTGLDELLGMIATLRFRDSDLAYLKKLGFRDDFLAYLETFSFKGDIFGMQEGEIVFPAEPLLRVDGTLLEGQLIETLLLNILNYQSLIATKASRIRLVSGHRTLSDFGLRRAQSFGAISGSRAACIGGFDTTSNVFAASIYGLTPSGTMAHSFIECFDDELEAFRKYADAFPDSCILLIDTYDTLKSGLPNAITVAKELEAKGHKMKAIRLDSGDLAYLSKKVRQILNKHGLHYVKIVVSNQLDEDLIKSLLDQHAPIDIFGVGTSMIIGRPEGALDGVYKLVESDHLPRLKISDNVQKTTLPGKKKVFRFTDKEGNYYADCVGLDDEDIPQKMIHPFEKEKSLDLAGIDSHELFICHMANGNPLKSPTPVKELRERVTEHLALLPPEHKRFTYPHIYKVGITEKLSDLRNSLLSKHRQYFQSPDTIQASE